MNEELSLSKVPMDLQMKTKNYTIYARVILETSRFEYDAAWPTIINEFMLESLLHLSDSTMNDYQSFQGNLGSTNHE